MRKFKLQWWCYLYVNKTKIYKFRTDDYTRWHSFCLGSISKNFTKDEQNEISLNGTVYNFSVDHSSIKKGDIQKWNDNEDRCECKFLKEYHLSEKDYIWNPTTCSCKDGKHLAIIIDDSIITCDDIIVAVAKLYNETTKTVPTKSTSTNLYILLVFLLIIILTLITVSIYYYLIKYKAKQKHLLPYYITNDKFYINKCIINTEKVMMNFKKIDVRNRTCHFWWHS